MLFLQEPDSEAVSHDMPTSAMSKPDSLPPTSMSAEDEKLSHEHTSVSVPDSQVITSSADTLMQLAIAENRTAHSADAVQSEPVFASANAKPRIEVKNDLSSMFKSLSAKMKMKSQRQSRFSDIVTAVSTVAESGLLSSNAGPVAEVSYVPAVISTVSESNHLPVTSDNRRPSSADRDTVRGSNNTSSQQLFGHVMPNLPLSVGSHSEVSAVHPHGYDVQKTVSSLISTSSEHLPAFPSSVSALGQNNGMIAMTYNVPSVTSSQLSE